MMNANCTEAVTTVELNQIACLGDQKYPSFELRTILAYLRAQGHDSWCEQLLLELDLDDDRLEEPFITAHQSLTALTKFMDDFYRPGLGHDVARMYTLDSLGQIGTCVSHADTLGEALVITNAYYDLIGSFNDLVNIVDDDAFTQRLVNVARLDRKIMRFLFELTVSGSITLAKELSGETINLKSICFEEVLPAPEKQFYRVLYNTDVEDNARFNEWTVSQESLDIALHDFQVDPDIAEQELKSLLELLNDEPGLVGDIDCILKGSAGDFPDPDMISHALGISTRTLRRRLKKLGTSYSALIDKVRCQLAINLIQNKNLCNESVAAELGYSDAANFCNAFKKWTGNVPSFYRVDS